jgi:non-heme chloroperoxidase
MPFVTAAATPTTEIYYEDYGQGPVVVLIHGWPLSHRMWEGQVNAFTAAGFRCVAYDRRGFGQSGRPAGGFDYDTFASDLNDLMVALDLRDVTLAGFSMGGGEVARYLGRYGSERVARAMLIAAVPPFLLKTPDNPHGIDGTVFDQMLQGIVEDRIGFLDGFMKMFFNITPLSSGPGSDYVAFAKSLAWPASPLGTQQCINAFGRTDFRADLAKFDVPTLVIHGDKDQIVPLDVSGKLAAQSIAGAKLAVVKGAPHGLNATHGAELNALMLEFLQRRS